MRQYGVASLGKGANIPCGSLLVLAHWDGSELAIITLAEHSSHHPIHGNRIPVHGGYLLHFGEGSGRCSSCTLRNWHKDALVYPW